MNNTELSLDALIERMEPYDCHRKEDFIKLLEEFPALKKSLELSLKTNKEWVEKAATGEVKFIINDNRRKIPKPFRKAPYVTLNFIRSVAVVSINIL